MKIAVFYGGRSCEHEVSVATGVQVMRSAEGHEIIPIYVGRDGEWISPRKSLDISTYRGFIRGKRCYAPPGKGVLKIGLKTIRPAAAIICNHGYGGEDGCLQGVLETARVAYTGCSVAASAIGMDKRLSRRAFEIAGLKTVEGLGVDRETFSNDLKAVVERAESIGYPLIVKPARLGSSVGVGVARELNELLNLLAAAFKWDNAAVIERALVDFTELNCAVLGDEKTVEVSLPEQPIASGELLSYADKYARGGFKGKSRSRRYPAEIPDETTKAVRAAAETAFRAIGASGIARVDFMLSGGELYVNEINTVPGSLALYLFPDYRCRGKSGGGAVIDRLIDIAVEQKRRRESLSYRYRDSIFGEKN